MDANNLKWNLARTEVINQKNFNGRKADWSKPFPILEGNFFAVPGETEGEHKVKNQKAVF
jgi:hypothetical protein